MIDPSLFLAKACPHFYPNRALTAAPPDLLFFPSVRNAAEIALSDSPPIALLIKNAFKKISSIICASATPRLFSFKHNAIWNNQTLLFSLQDTYRAIQNSFLLIRYLFLLIHSPFWVVQSSF